MSDGSGGETNILREYLIALGFRVDGKGERQTGATLKKMDKAATRLGKSLVGAALAAQAMVTEFAFRMEKLYYSSKLAESAAGNLQALDFAGKQAGIKDFTGNVINLARAIRANPGLQGLLNSLGVKVEGRDKADVLKDLVKALSSMPQYIAQQYAGLFGISPDDLLLMQQGMKTIEQFEEMRKKAAADVGVDSEEAVRVGREYAQEWRTILMYVGLFRDALSMQLIPYMHQLAGATKEVLGDWIRIVNKKHEAEGITPQSAKASGLTVEEQQRMAERIQKQPKQKGFYELSPDERAARGMPESDNGKPWTVWDFLTPEERKAKGLPATEADMPWGERAWRALKATSPFRNANPGGGVELSDSAKERLGQDRFKASNPSPARAVWDKLWSKVYKSQPKTPVDPAAIEFVTAPDEPSPDRMEAGPIPPGVVIEGAQPALPKGDAQVPPVPEKVADRYPMQEDLLSRLEEAKGLPPGLLDYIWKTESGRSTRTDIQGPATRSGERAQGPFQFMSDTSKQYGLKNPQDFGESAKAAASYMHDLIGKYGDMRFAMAAYNWGQGNLDKLMLQVMQQHPEASQQEQDRYVLGMLPKETREYIAGLGGSGDGQGSGGQMIEVNAKTEINVSGNSADPKAVAREIADNQQRVWADIARDFSPKVR